MFHFIRRKCPGQTTFLRYMGLSAFTDEHRRRRRTSTHRCRDRVPKRGAMSFRDYVHFWYFERTTGLTVHSHLHGGALTQSVTDVHFASRSPYSRRGGCCTLRATKFSHSVPTLLNSAQSVQWWYSIRRRTNEPWTSPVHTFPVYDVYITHYICHFLHVILNLSNYNFLFQILLVLSATFAV